MDNLYQTLSDFEYNMLRWANKKLNEPKLLTWDFDSMVSEDFLLIFFYKSMGANHPQVWRWPIWTPGL